jgi:signal transduction histidine kinase
VSEPARHRRDLAIGLAGAALGAVDAVVGGFGATGVVAGCVLGGALGLSRRRPRAAWLVATVALLAMARYSDDSWAAAVLLPAHAFGAARWDGRAGSVAGLIALIVAWELGTAIAHESYVPGVLIPATAWAAGRVLRDRERVAARLAERARELEEEREAHAALSVRYERARIASELHDIVAHALSVMVVQASAGQRLAARDMQATAETLDAIAGAARQAEDDIGRLVSLLGDDVPIAPAPDVALVEELVTRAAGSGLDVTLRLEGERDGLPAPAVHAAYRVVQEGLTNALRHAAGAPVSVLVRGDRGALTVEVENAAATGRSGLADVGSGNGLRGLRERVGACGGTVAAGPTANGGWRLSAQLPRRVVAAAH